MTMSVRLQHINADTTWLLSIPAVTEEQNPRTFNILIDPWLSGPQIDYSRFFSRQHYGSSTPRYSSVPALSKSLPEGQKIDAIFICHDFTDHCHEETLKTASKDTIIYAGKLAADRVKSWKYFKSDNIFSIPLANSRKHDYEGRSLRDLEGSSHDIHKHLPDSVKIVYIPAGRRFDMTGIRLHGATIITFTLPKNNVSTGNEKRYAVIYAPHGTTASSLQPWLASNPGIECLALIHGLDEVNNPWYLAGPIMLGPRSSIPLCTLLHPRIWVQTHDEIKPVEGIVSKITRRKPWTREQCAELLDKEGVDDVDIVVLESGETAELLK